MGLINMKIKKERVAQVIILCIGFLAVSLSIYIKSEFGDAQFEQLLFSLLYADGTSNEIVVSAALYCLPFIIVLLTLCILLTIDFGKTISIIFDIDSNKKKNTTFKFQIFPLKHYVFLSVLITAICMFIEIYPIRTVRRIKRRRKM